MISKELASLIRNARRPVFIWGAGMRAYSGQARALARSLGIPVACTWGAIDLMHHDDPLMCGGFGTHGTRAANFAVQNSDLVVSIGSRLDTKATGIPAHFARGAAIVMVDIDVAEIRKFDKLGRKIDIGLEMDAGEFIDALAKENVQARLHEEWPGPWLERIQYWKRAYADPPVTWPGINPYHLMREIASYTTSEDIICTDTGFALGWTMQAFPWTGQRFLHALNMTPMGYGIPAAIGAALASGPSANANRPRRIVLVTGDGSILMSLSELATVARWHLPIKIILLDNKGHGMCRQTQRQWLGGNYPGTSIEGGLGMPADWTAVAESFGIEARDGYMGRKLLWGNFFSSAGAAFKAVKIDPDAQLIPQARFGQPLEDADPQLPWEELCEQMIVEPLPRTK